MGNIHESTLSGALAKQNYYVVVPDNLVDTSTAQELAVQHDLNFVDMSQLLGIAASAVLQSRQGWEDIDPDSQLLSDDSPEERARLEIAISKRRKFIASELGKSCFSSDKRRAIEYDFGDANIFSEHEELIGMLRTSKTVQDQISSWVRIQAEETGGLLVLGDEPSAVDSTKFQVLTPSLPVGMTSEDLTPDFIGKQVSGLVHNAARAILSRRRVSKEQTRIAMPRETFVWSGNDLVGEIRRVARGPIEESSHALGAEGVTEFDVSAQLLMHIPAYKPEEIWQGNRSKVDLICNLLAEGRGVEANEALAKARGNGAVVPNMELIGDEVRRHSARLADHYEHLEVVKDGRSLKLPAAYMGSPDQNPFKGVGKTEIDANGRTVTNPGKLEESMEVRERHTGRRIIFKPIPEEVSRLYSLGFSNLHYARDGEIGAFGAFLEDDELPFAYSSYSPVTRQYTKDMLGYLEIDPSTIIESTRAWNAHWAPENTMSTLFSFAHSMLKSRQERAIANGDAERRLEGVVTSINPNLGFKAVSFRGVRFNVAGTKPTGFSYIRNADGTADFMPAGQIKEILGVSNDAELEAHQRFVKPQIPLLPTLEFLALFDGKAERTLLSRPIYNITPDAIRRN